MIGRINSGGGSFDKSYRKLLDTKEDKNYILVGKRMLKATYIDQDFNSGYYYRFTAISSKEGIGLASGNIYKVNKELDRDRGIMGRFINKTRVASAPSEYYRPVFIHSDKYVCITTDSESRIYMYNTQSNTVTQISIPYASNRVLGFSGGVTHKDILYVAAYYTYKGPSLVKIDLTKNTFTEMIEFPKGDLRIIDINSKGVLSAIIGDKLYELDLNTPKQFYMKKQFNNLTSGINPFIYWGNEISTGSFSILSDDDNGRTNLTGFSVGDYIDKYGIVLSGSERNVISVPVVLRKEVL